MFQIIKKTKVEKKDYDDMNVSLETMEDELDAE